MTLAWRLLLVTSLLLMAFALSACGRTNIDAPTPTSAFLQPTETPLPPPNANLEATRIAQEVAQGDVLFHTNYSDVGFACSNCHSVEDDAVLVGPSLQNIAQIASNRVEGQDASEYIHNAILHPNDYLVDGFNGGLMPATYDELFTEEEVDALTAYLMTLGAPEATPEAETTSEADDTSEDDSEEANPEDDSEEAEASEEIS